MPILPLSTRRWTRLAFPEAVRVFASSSTQRNPGAAAVAARLERATAGLMMTETAPELLSRVSSVRRASASKRFSCDEGMSLLKEQTWLLLLY